MKRGLNEFIFEYMLKGLNDWQTFILEEKLKELRADVDFMTLSQDGLQYSALALNDAQLGKTIGLLHEYLISKGFVKEQGLNDINQMKLRLTDSGKEVQKIGSVLKWEAEQLSRIEKRQDVQDERMVTLTQRMVYLTWWIAGGAIVASIAYGTQTLEYWYTHSFDVERLLYSVFGGIVTFLLLKSKDILKSK